MLPYVVQHVEMPSSSPHRELQTEDSKKIHANLVIALILLNLHLIPSEVAAESSSPGLCLYMALALHYSLLATFCWMGLEGFHLFRLMVKVFNIYINRYMLKIILVGWGECCLHVTVSGVSASTATLLWCFRCSSSHCFCCGVSKKGFLWTHEIVQEQQNVSLWEVFEKKFTFSNTVSLRFKQILLFHSHYHSYNKIKNTH